jgi:ribonucleoside-diphosphate reductase beta chain
MINPTLFNTTKNDYEKPSLFLGQDMGLFDNVNEHYPEIMAIYEKLRAQDWWFTEIDLSSCNAEFKSCDKSTYDMMLLTLKTQWLMDSMVARTIAVTTAPFVTSSELYGCWSRIGENEALHALTYSQIVRNSFDDPSVVLADTMELEEGMGRIKVTGEAASQVHEIGCRLALGETSRDDPRAYDAILLYVVTVLCIERLQFMASFAVTFAIGDSGQFLPIAKLIQKICSDELECHVELDKAVLRRELATSRGKETRKRLDPQIREIVEEVLEFELWWCEYLFSEGRELVGMSLELLQEWVLFCARDVYEFLEIETDRKFPETNPIPWIESWLKNDHQPSPQEEKPTAYMLGAVKDTAGSKVFDVDL